jgi:hypothetical protein
VVVQIFSIDHKMLILKESVYRISQHGSVQQVELVSSPEDYNGRCRDQCKPTSDVLLNEIFQIPSSRKITIE